MWSLLKTGPRSANIVSVNRASTLQSIDGHIVRLDTSTYATVPTLTGLELLQDVPETRGSSRSVTEHQPVGDRPGRHQWRVVIVGRRRNGPLLSSRDDNGDDDD